MLQSAFFSTFVKRLTKAREQEEEITSLPKAEELRLKLEKARLKFEGDLSEALAPLSEKKQKRLLLQLLGNFQEFSKFYKVTPHYLTGDFTDLGSSFMQWKEPIKDTFLLDMQRDDPKGFIDVLEWERDGYGKGLALFRRLDACYTGGYVETTELDLDEASNLIGYLISENFGQAQHNVWKYFDELVGRKESAPWILNRDRRLDAYRELQGLPYQPQTFQESYENWRYDIDKPNVFVKEQAEQSISSRDKLINLHLDLQERRERLDDMRRRRDEMAAEVKKNGWQSITLKDDPETRKKLTEKILEALTHEPSGEPYTDDFKWHIRTVLCRISLFEIPAFLHTKFPSPDITDLAYLSDILTELKEDCQQSIELEMDDPEDRRLLPLIERCQQWLNEQDISKKVNATSVVSDFPIAVRNHVPASEEIKFLIRKPYIISLLLNQFFKLKGENPLAALVFKYQSVYLSFNEDAEAVSNALSTVVVNDIIPGHGNVSLTSFPSSDFDTILSKLVRAGLRIAICEQQTPNVDESKAIDGPIVLPSPVANKSVLTIADLCLPPFTPNDLAELLTHLQVVQNGKWHLGYLASRKAWPKSAFPAAYRVLSNKKNALMKEVDDVIWSEVFRTEFAVEFSERTANYNEDMRGSRPEFANYLTQAQDWVHAWKERLNRSASV